MVEHLHDNNHMRYLIGSIPDLCTLTYYDHMQGNKLIVNNDTNLNL